MLSDNETLAQENLEELDIAEESIDIKPTSLTDIEIHSKNKELIEVEQNTNEIKDEYMEVCNETQIEIEVKKVLHEKTQDIDCTDDIEKKGAFITFESELANENLANSIEYEEIEINPVSEITQLNPIAQNAKGQHKTATEPLQEIHEVEKEVELKDDESSSSSCKSNDVEIQTELIYDSLDDSISYDSNVAVEITDTTNKSNSQDGNN